MPGDPTPLGLLEGSIRRLSQRVDELEKETEELSKAQSVAMAESKAVLDRVATLVKSTDRNTNALITVAGSLLVTGFCGVIVALIVKGAIG